MNSRLKLFLLLAFSLPALLVFLNLFLYFLAGAAGNSRTSTIDLEFPAFFLLVGLPFAFYLTYIDMQDEKNGTGVYKKQ